MSTLRQSILEELQLHPDVDVRRVRISAAGNGVVTLEGAVPTYADKCCIEEIVRMVAGVTGIQNQIEVRLTIGDYRTDATLERVLREMFECLSRMPPERPGVSVAGGWVTLEGNVATAFQRQLVENAVRGVAGVRGITNLLTVMIERRAERPPLASSTS